MIVGGDIGFTAVDWPKFVLLAASPGDAFADDESLIYSPMELDGFDSSRFTSEATDIYQECKKEMSPDDASNLDRFVCWTFGENSQMWPRDCELHPDFSKHWDPICILNPDKVSDLATIWETIDHGKLKEAIGNNFEANALCFETANEAWLYLELWAARIRFANERHAGFITYHC